MIINEINKTIKKTVSYYLLYVSLDFIWAWKFPHLEIQCNFTAPQWISVSVVRLSDYDGEDSRLKRWSKVGQISTSITMLTAQWWNRLTLSAFMEILSSPVNQIYNIWIKNMFQVTDLELRCGVGGGGWIIKLFGNISDAKIDWIHCSAHRKIRWWVLVVWRQLQRHRQFI